MTRKRILYIIVGVTIATNLWLVWLARNEIISTRAFGIAGLGVLIGLMVIGFLVARRLPREEVPPPEKTVRALRSLIFLYGGFGALAAVRGALDGWTRSDTTGLMWSAALITAFFLAYRQAKKRSGE
jgi:hypothetical protein